MAGWPIIALAGLALMAQLVHCSASDTNALAQEDTDQEILSFLDAASATVSPPPSSFRDLWSVLVKKKEEILWKKLLVKNLANALQFEPIDAIIQFLKKVIAKLEEKKYLFLSLISSDKAKGGANTTTESLAPHTNVSSATTPSTPQTTSIQPPTSTTTQSTTTPSPWILASTTPSPFSSGSMYGTTPALSPVHNQYGSPPLPPSQPSPVFRPQPPPVYSPQPPPAYRPQPPPPPPPLPMYGSAPPLYPKPSTTQPPMSFPLMNGFGATVSEAEAGARHNADRHHHHDHTHSPLGFSGHNADGHHHHNHDHDLDGTSSHNRNRHHHHHHTHRNRV